MEDDSGEVNKENLWELSCDTVREQLANSIRKQWRMLKNHVEKLDNQGKAGIKIVLVKTLFYEQSLAVKLNNECKMIYFILMKTNDITVTTRQFLVAEIWGGLKNGK